MSIWSFDISHKNDFYPQFNIKLSILAYCKFEKENIFRDRETANNYIITYLVMPTFFLFPLTSHTHTQIYFLMSYNLGDGLFKDAVFTTLHNVLSNIFRKGFNRRKFD